MTIDPIVPQPNLSYPPSLDPETAANSRSVFAAVGLLNDTGPARSSRQFSIAIDPTTRLAVVRIVDLATNEVIEQLPSEYILQIARNLGEKVAK